MDSYCNEALQTFLAKRAIIIDGPNDTDPQIKPGVSLEEIFSEGFTSLGEHYVAGNWGCKQLDAFFTQVFLLDKQHQFFSELQSHCSWFSSLTALFKSSTLPKSIKQQTLTPHFNLDPKFYALMLDSRLNYSAAYWRSSHSLEDAQLAKLALTCGKLRIRPGMRVLNIGCAWGSFPKYAASQYKASVVGITPSRRQANYAKKLCADLPVDIKSQHFLDIQGSFDRIVCLSLFEHLNEQEQAAFMGKMSQLLTDQGLMLIQSVGATQSNVETPQWIKQYVFPSLNLPSITKMTGYSEPYFVLEDYHNISMDFEKTMAAWLNNLAVNWMQIQELGCKEEFKRLWEFYLNLARAAFRSQLLQTWQCVFSKIGGREDYRSIR